MRTARWRLLGATGAAAIAAFVLLPDGLADLWYQGVSLVLLAVLLGVLIRNRREVELAWGLLSVGLVAISLRGLASYFPSSQAADAAQLALLAVGYAAMIAATVRFIARRSDLRDVDGIIDVLLLTFAAAVVLWQFAARPMMAEPSRIGPAIALVFPVIQALALALAVRFMFWGTWRVASAWLLFGGTVSLLLGNLAYLVSYDGARGEPQGLPGAFWLLGLLLFVLAAAHRSRVELTQAMLPSMSTVPYARLALMAVALIAAPAVVFARAHTTETGFVPAVGSLILTTMIVGRLVRVVIQREQARAEIRSRANQQQALVALGQRALAGSELARLYDEATAAIAATMTVDFVGIFEPAGAETLALRAAVGWEMNHAQRSTVSTSEPFFGVPLVAGAPGYLDKERHTHGIRTCELLASADVSSGVSVTIGTPAQRYGVLAVATTTARRFSVDDVTYLRAVANVLTAAIERTRTEDEVSQAALHDPLTGLPNRVLLLDRIESALSRASRQDGRVAVMFVDLDGFKAVNDTFGHRAGDQLLVAVARRLQQALRAEDTLARLAGDEFVVLCERIEDMATIEAVAGRIVETLRAPFVLDDGTAQISGSIGVSVATGHGDDVDQLLRDADTAMYRAKKAGKSRYEFAADEWILAQQGASAVPPA